jgi:hypothetical protein
VSAPPLSLERLQLWMQTAVVQPGSVEHAVRTPEAAALVPAERVGEVLLPNDALTSLERLGIYQGMYLLRMEEALESDYPGLKHFLGARRFFELVRDYVQVFPSRAYTLNRLGDHFPEFVGSEKAGLRRRVFCHDLARLELAVAEVFDAEETEALSAEAIAAVPETGWERARLRPIAAFRLLALSYPVSDYLESVHDDAGHDHPSTRARPSFVAVYRRNYTVRRLDLSRGAHDLLAALAAGTALGDAVASAITPGGRRAPKPDDLFRWFRQWVAGGVFRAVDLQG